jgi:hypothetical protein
MFSWNAMKMLTSNLRYVHITGSKLYSYTIIAFNIVLTKQNSLEIIWVVKNACISSDLIYRDQLNE